MSTPEKALAKRIRDLRRRHFGPRGKGQFARVLGVPLETYERFERCSLPPGDIMVRMCEATGEDLQWLLTGVAGRGTVVISGARGRHQSFLTQVARALDDRPELAAPMEAFLDLLLRGEDAKRGDKPRLPTLTPEALIPLVGRNEWPDELPDPDGPGGGHWLAPPTSAELLKVADRMPAGLCEPGLTYDPAAVRAVTLLSVPRGDAAPGHLYVQGREIAQCFPGMFGVVLDDNTMEPMFTAGDAVLVAAGAEQRLGRPALCKFDDRANDRCRIWLGEDEQHIYLGRVSDGRDERMPRDQLRWSREVLYRVARAA